MWIGNWIELVDYWRPLHNRSEHRKFKIRSRSRLCRGLYCRTMFIVHKKTGIFRWSEYPGFFVSHHYASMRKFELQHPRLNPNFPLGAPAVLFVCWRRIFGHFCCSSLSIASYWRLIRNKTASKSASAIITNPNGKSGLNSVLRSSFNWFSCCDCVWINWFILWFRNNTQW